MTEHQKFFRCRRCGNLVGLIENAGVPLVCCGEPMKELEANTAEAAQEKHVPVVTRKEGQIRVSVGDIHHPMEENISSNGYICRRNGADREKGFIRDKNLRPSFA